MNIKIEMEDVELYDVREAMVAKFIKAKENWEIAYRNNPYNMEVWEFWKEIAERYRKIVEKCNDALTGVYNPIRTKNL